MLHFDIITYLLFIPQPIQAYSCYYKRAHKLSVLACALLYCVLSVYDRHILVYQLHVVTLPVVPCIWLASSESVTDTLSCPVLPHTADAHGPAGGSVGVLTGHRVQVPGRSEYSQQVHFYTVYGAPNLCILPPVQPT